MIAVEHLVKRFAGVTAVNDISFTVEKGEILGFLGPNGAGKTTTMRVLACFFPPSSGRVSVGGLDVIHHSMDVRRIVGYMPESVPLYPDMRVDEYLRYRARLKGVTWKDQKRRIDEVLSRCDLHDVRRRIVGQLSKGFRQRVGLAESMVNDPALLILDEPTIGLDPNQIRHVRDVVKDLGHDHTVILSTHILPEVEMTCSRVVVIHRGRIAAADSMENFRRGAMAGGRIRAEIRGPAGAVREALAALPDVSAVRAEPNGDYQSYVIEYKGGQDLREPVFAAAARNQWGLRELRFEKKTLEDVFVSITAREE
ncbi:MAG: ATP-binding cassette domain-containing protein [Planctomycetes bacterium]|nr:ATP-binding cassette domain-containing protein [Planctomycetota bacterium]